MNFNKGQATNSKTYWANITWMLLHTFPKTLTNDFFIQHKETILTLLYDICVSVPCPICAKHAIANLKEYNYFHKKINNSVRDLEVNIFNFHNKINKMLLKPLVSVDILKEYETIDFSEIYKKWTANFTINVINLKLYTQKIAVKNAKDRFVEFVSRYRYNLIINYTKITELTVIPMAIQTTNTILPKPKNYKTTMGKMFLLK